MKLFNSTENQYSFAHHVCLRDYRSVQGNRGGFAPSLESAPPVPNPAQFEFLRQISEDPNNLVVGLVRDKAATEKKIAAELGDRPNVHILHGDLSNYASLKQAAAHTAQIVGERGVDYLVANAALLPSLDVYRPIGAL